MTDPLRGEEAEDRDEPVRFLGGWRGLYAAVIVYTLGLIVLLYILTRVLDKSVA